MFTVSFAGFWGQAQLTLEQSIDRIETYAKAFLEYMTTWTA